MTNNMELTINERKIRLSGTANIPKGLEMDKTYDLTISDAVMTGSHDHSNDNGTYDVIYPLKLSQSSEIHIISEKDVIKAKKKGSMSVVLRVMLERLAEKLDQDPERYYQQRMIEIIDGIKNELD